MLSHKCQSKSNHSCENDSNVLSIGTEDTSQSTLVLEFVKSCVAKVDSRGKQAVSVPPTSNHPHLLTCIDDSEESTKPQ